VRVSIELLRYRSVSAMVSKFAMVSKMLMSCFKYGIMNGFKDGSMNSFKDGIMNSFKDGSMNSFKDGSMNGFKDGSMQRCGTVTIFTVPLPTFKKLWGSGSGSNF
jgi:hypothetical protein